MSVVRGREITVSSPGGNVEVKLKLKKQVPTWSVRFDNQTVVNQSRMKLLLGEKPQEFLKFETDGAQFSSNDSTWQPTWGQTSIVRNHYNQVRWKLKSASACDVTIEVRVFDDALAVRYLPSETVQPFSDRTEFDFAGDFTFWAANKERANHGPIRLSQWDRRKLQMPMTIEAGPEIYMAVLEAAIDYQYPFSMVRLGQGTRYQTVCPPAVFPRGSGTAWRVITFGRQPGDLITNHTLGNLNPPLAIETPSWIKPGVALWDWRAWGATAPDGFQYGLDMASWRRFIDFAARKENVRYVMLDANWYGPEFDPNEDPKTSRDHLVEQLPSGKIVRKPAPDHWDDPIDVPAMIKYARQRDVGIILYFNDHARENFDFEETLSLYERWGAAGIKYGFMKTTGNAKVRETRKIVELCAKHKLLCNFHDGPIPGSGDSRPYPNYITREFCHAQSDARRSFSPETFCTSVFVNMLTGALDMNNGLYAIENAQQARPRIFEKVETTVVAETARTMICFSGLAVIPDIPEAYDAKSDLFAFIEAMPMTWDQSLVLNGKIGDHITLARRSADQWFVASACDENGAELKIDLSFLEDGEKYMATLFEDAADTHFQTNPESYSIRQLTVKKGDVVTAKLAPGGGHCVWLQPVR